MLVVHRSASGATLARALADVLAVAPADPFAAEVIAVPAKGVERWLAQRLAHVLGAVDGAGVCANVHWPWPAALVDDAVRAASPEHAAAVERWQPSSVVWPLLEVLDANLSQPWCRPLARHLEGDDAANGRRFAVAANLAGSFDTYGHARPQMMLAWAAGRDEVGDGSALPDDLRWQSELWRLLRDHLGTPAPAELLDDACRRLRARPDLTTLPGRLSVFGASRLSPARLMVLAALAERRDVHLWLHHPSPALWDTVERVGDVRRRRDDPTTRSLANPLLASMARDLIELQHLVRRAAPAADVLHHPPPPVPDTLLGRLKRDLARDEVPAEPAPLRAGDRSVSVHACHGRARQVEVIREVVLGLLTTDPTLEPRDVLVMCPDVEAFAPLVAAAFSLGSQDDGGHPAARLRVRLADRALRQTNPLLDVLALLLDLGTARLSAPQVLDLAGRVAVRQRFGFDDDALERLRGWVVSAGIRWGLHAAHREAWKLGGIDQGTWRAGLDRLLVGVAVEGDEVVDDVLPVDDVDSADIDLLGRFAELVDRLDAALSLMSHPHTPGEWTAGLRDAVLGLAGTRPRDAWQQAQLVAELDDLARAGDDSTVSISLADVRGALSAALAGRPTRASFRTGTMTVCTLVPMRSVPHRVVVLMGLDDGAFPRQSTRDGDDVLAREPWVGERDPRSEDRQLLLDAVLAAEQHLVIAYSGADARTGAEIVPAVPLGELLDALDRTASATDNAGRSQRVRDSITTRHPLQPFDTRNFADGSLGAPGPFSFDRLALAGARAATRPRTPVPPFLVGPLPPANGRDVDLDALHHLLAHPARGFLRQRLGVVSAWAEQEPADALPIAPDQLEEWAVGDRVLRRRLRGLDPAQITALERHAGALPPGPSGDLLMQGVGHRAEAVALAAEVERQGTARSCDIDVDLGDGSALTGTVSGVYGDVVVSTTYSVLAARQRLQAWVDLVALTATEPGRRWRAVAVGRHQSGARRSMLGPITPADARATLDALVALYRAGLLSPLPLPVKTAAEYAERRDRGDDVHLARAAAARKWLTDRFPGEQDDAEHRLLYGRLAGLAVLTHEPPADDETWFADETDRFGQLARRLWTPLLAVETQATG